MSYKEFEKSIREIVEDQRVYRERLERRQAEKAAAFLGCYGGAESAYLNGMGVFRVLEEDQIEALRAAWEVTWPATNNKGKTMPEEKKITITISESDALKTLKADYLPRAVGDAIAKELEPAHTRWFKVQSKSTQIVLRNMRYAYRASLGDSAFMYLRQRMENNVGRCFGVRALEYLKECE